MVSLLTIVHVSVCIFLIIIVLLQHGKGADMGATFGGGGSGQTVFGTDGPLPLLNKITTGIAILFMLTSVTLAYYSANTSTGSVMEEVKIAPPIERVIEVAPTPVEIPMEKSSSNEGASTDGTAPTSATFPGEPSAPTPIEPQGETVPSHK